jgi:hypothetical protein
MAATQPGLPAHDPFDKNGQPNRVWLQFLNLLYQRVGGASGNPSAFLDGITTVPGSMLLRGLSAWGGLAPGLPFRVLRSISGAPEWDLLDGNSFGTQGGGQFFASPAGGAGPPGFRAIQSSDIPPVTPTFPPQSANAFFAGPTPSFRQIFPGDLVTVAGQFPGTTTNDSAQSGAVGEYQAATAPNTSHTVTISNGANATITWATHGLTPGSPVHFTTTGSLPTGLTVGTNYYVCTLNFAVGSFTVSTTLANAFAGTAVTTSSAGTGTHTANSAVILASGSPIDVAGILLTAGDWDVWANLAVSAALTSSNGWIGQTSATDPGAPNLGAYVSWLTEPAVPVGMQRITVAGATTQIAYLSMNPTFGGSSNGFGYLAARRAR